VKRSLPSLGLPVFSPISVRIGLKSVQLLQIRSNQGKPVGFNTESIPIEGSGDEGDRAITKALRAGLKKGNFRGRKAVLCLCGEDVLIQHQRIKVEDGEEIGDDIIDGAGLSEKIKHELRLHSAFDAKDATIRHIPVGEVYERHERKQEMILVIVKRTLIDRYLKIFNGLRLSLIRIGAESFTVQRAVSSFCPKDWTSDAPTGVVNIGETKAEILVIREGKVAFVRSLPLGLDKFTESIARRMNIDKEGMARIVGAMEEGRDVNDSIKKAVRAAVRPEMEFLSAEVQTCFRYFSVNNQNTAVGQVVVFGNGTTLLAGKEFIEERLHLPVHLWEKEMRGAGEGADGLDAHLEDSFVSLAGLAVEDASGEGAGIDFIPPEIEEKRTRRKINQLRAVYLVIVLALMGTFYLKSGQRKGVLNNLNQMYQSRCDLLQMSSGKVEKLRVTTGEFEKLEKKLENTASPFLLTRLLAEITCVSGLDISLTRLETAYSFGRMEIIKNKKKETVIDYSRPVVAITVQGFALDSDDVSEFVDRIKKTGAFSTVRDEGAWNAQQASGVVLKQFTIKLAVGETTE
jgi:type IV pilus assembly protein PilM